MERHPVLMAGQTSCGEDGIRPKVICGFRASSIRTPMVFFFSFKSSQVHPKVHIESHFLILKLQS